MRAAPSSEFIPAGSSIPAEESVKKTPSPKASTVKKMTPSASDVKKTRAAEKEPKRERPPQQKKKQRPSASKHLKKLLLWTLCP